jgi:hypothetical protein
MPIDCRITLWPVKEQYHKMPYRRSVAGKNKSCAYAVDVERLSDHHHHLVIPLPLFCTMADVSTEWGNLVCNGAQCTRNISAMV